MRSQSGAYIMFCFAALSYFALNSCWASDTRMVRLENGMSVVLTENKKAPLVSIYHFVKAGSLHEKPGVTGIAHLFEHMMFRPVRSGESGFFEKIAALAGDTNAHTRFESTLYSTQVPASALQKALYLESDRFMNMKVTDALLNVERQAVVSEYATKFDNSALVNLWLTAYRTAYPGHPFGWTIIGNREDLDKITAKECNTFYSNLYRPQNTGLFISGNFQSSRVLTWVKEYYGAWEKTAPSTLPENFKHETEFKRVQTKFGSKVRNVMFGIRVPLDTPENSLVTSLAGFILLESGAALANQKLILDKKMATNLGPFNFWDDSGLIKAVATLDSDVELDKVVQEFLQLTSEVEKLTDLEFGAYVRDYEVQIQEGMLKNEVRTQILARSWGKWGDLDLVSNLKKNLQKIKKQDVVGLLKKYWNQSNLIVVTNAGDTR